MHEVSIVQGMFKILEDETNKHGATRVTKVHVRIGELANIVPDAFSFAFETIKEGTLADGAVLNIEVVPAKGRCEKCNIDFPVDAVMFLCPECGGVASEVISGKELEVAEIEAE